MIKRRGAKNDSSLFLILCASTFNHKKNYKSSQLTDIFLEKLFSTILIAIILFLAALALLGISWLFKRKSTIKMGGCGQDPNKKRSKECGDQIHCSLCDSQEKLDLPEDDANTLQKK